MRYSQATDVLYYKIFGFTINIDIVRKENRTKKSFPRFIKQQIDKHRLFCIIKQ